VSPSSVVHALDLFGVAVFAVSGALAAGRKGMDLFGVMVVSAVTAVGGGTLRDVLLDNQPLFWVRDIDYLLVTFGAAALTLAYVRAFRPPRGSLLVADAFGLALFTVIGAGVTHEAGAPALICVVMGAVTGSAGGLLRDVLCAEVPLLLRRDVYALAAVAGASLYVLLEGSGVAVTVSAPVSVAAVFAIRLAAIRWDLHAPSFELDEDDRPR
jgi:uncharacterized membrane protein YeiH